MLSDNKDIKEKRTAGEAGWRLSRYNLMAPLPGTDRIGIANLFRATFSDYDPGEVYLLTEAESLPEDHPILGRFRERGLIVDFDEQQAMRDMGKSFRDTADTVTLTICTTMRCNFDCPYCFELHSGVDMSDAVQDDVAALAERMIKTFHPKKLHVIWFGGEPLLAPDVIWSLTKKLQSLTDSCKVAYTAGIITNGYLLTQEIADRLAQNGIRYGIIALDGVGDAHDRSRHLRGGGGTFERITDNIRSIRIPFPVSIRHVITGTNLDQIGSLQEFTQKLSAESGNRLCYAPDACGWNNATDARGADVRLLEGDTAAEIGLLRDKYRFTAARGGYCGGCSIGSVDIDSKGRLYKCWPEMDNLKGRSFGNAKDWDPADPVRTADDPLQLTGYLDTAVGDNDPECMECIWLPLCAGGCPYYRVNIGKSCLPYRDMPEKFIQTLYERMTEENRA
ncbi:MAG: radical SAM protein [Lachnospiraceae bacterium]|nr:radical SAM protein [Lachnospiraceae bacterium]